MSRKVQKAKERCAVCGGELCHTTITHEERRATKLYLFQNVPAQVCTACGEIWIHEATLQAIDRLIREGEPVGKVETPVYDLAAASGK